jgi:hypothetical protein
MNCPYCSCLILETDRFCASCGAPNYHPKIPTSLLIEIKTAEDFWIRYDNLPEDIKVSADYRIPVVSLIPYNLILASEAQNWGADKKRPIYRFSKIGETKAIPYYELEDVVSYNRKFAETLLFGILDKYFVSKNKLEDIYKTELDKTNGE